MMKNWFRMAWNFIRVFWWIIILVIVVALVGFVYLVNRKKMKQIELEANNKAPSLVAETMKHIQNATTDFKIERAVIKTKTEGKRAELEDIRKEPDGEKRRERLAALLRKSL